MLERGKNPTQLKLPTNCFIEKPRGSRVYAFHAEKATQVRKIANDLITNGIPSYWKYQPLHGRNGRPTYICSLRNKYESSSEQAKGKREKDIIKQCDL